MVLGEDSNEEEDVDDYEEESDWEDVEQEVSDKLICSTMSLKNFSMMCDRFLVSDTEGAMLANGLLQDLGIGKDLLPS